jgi:UDP-N-acetyl-D-glucosamine dehydrogenase
MRKYRIDLRSVPLSPDELRAADAVLIVTDHAAVDYTLVGQHARLVVDTRDAMTRALTPRARIVKA